MLGIKFRLFFDIADDLDNGDGIGVISEKDDNSQFNEEIKNYPNILSNNTKQQLKDHRKITELSGDEMAMKYSQSDLGLLRENITQ